MATLARIEAAFNRAYDTGDMETAKELGQLIRDIKAGSYKPPEETPKEPLEFQPKNTNNENAGFFENIRTGFGSGAVGMGETFALGAAAFYEEEEELKARDKIRRTADAFRPEGGDQDSLTYGISSALGSVAGIAVPAAIAAYSAPAVAATAVGTGVAGLLGVGASRGEASERARFAGATEEERNTAINSILVNAAGVAEALPMGRVFKSIDVPVLNKFIDKLSPEAAEGISGRLKNAAITGGLEGVQEVSAEIAQNLTEQEYNALAETFGGARESFTMGAAAGAILDLFLGKRARGSKPTGADPQETVVAEEGTTIEEETARDARNEEQIDMFSAELDDAEIADLERGDVGPNQEDIVRENERRAGERIETGATEQIDMLEDDAETVEAERLIAQDDVAAEAETRLRQESELESVTGRVEGRAVSESNARRESILQEVIEANPTTNYNVVKRKFTEALSNEGLTDNKANEKEILTIQRAVNVQIAEQNANAPIPSDSDVSDMEAQIPEKIDPAAREQATAKALAELKGIPVGEATQVIKPKAPEGEAAALLAANNIPVNLENTQGAEVGGVSTDAKALVKKLTGKKLPTVKGAPKQGQRRSAVPTGEVLTPTDTSSVKTASTSKDVDIVEFGVKYPNAIPEGTEFTNPADADAIDALLTKRIPRDAKGIEQTARDYFKRFDRPAEAYASIAYEIANETPAYVTPKNTPISEIAKFKGTGGVNTKATLEWVEQNLSADAKTEIDKRIKENQNLNRASKKDRASVAKTEKLNEQVEKGAPRKVATKEEAEAQSEENQARIDASQEEDAIKRGEEKTTTDSEKVTTKVNKAQKTKEDADKNFLNLTNNPKTDFTSTDKNGMLSITAKRNRVRAKEYAAAGIDPATSNEILNKVFSSRKADAEAVKKATANVASRQESKTKPKPVTTRKKTLEKIIPKFLGKEGLTREEIIGAYNIAVLDASKPKMVAAAEKWFATATPKQVREAATLYSVQRMSAKSSNLELDPKVVAELNSDVPTSVTAFIKKNDIKGALEELHKSSRNKRVKQIIRALANNIGSTKVELVTSKELSTRGFFAKTDTGVLVSTYDADSDTILINIDVPFTTHALIHESAHAATDKILSNKSHPVTKQLTKLYNDVKGELDTAYGAMSLEEFVSEAFSNPEFQYKLASINTKGEQINSLEKFFRAVSNFVRNLIGMDTIPLGSALESVDAAIISVLYPSPDTRDGSALIAMSSPDDVKQILKDMKDVQRYVSSGSKKEFIKDAIAFLSNNEMSIIAKDMFTRLANSQMLGDLARDSGFAQLGLDLHAAFEGQRYALQVSQERVKNILKVYDAWVKDAGIDAKEALDRIVYSDEYGATIYQVDPTLTESEAKKRYKDKFDTSGNKDLFDIWKKQRKDWDSLEKNGGQDQFNTQRKAYRDMYEALVKVINREIDGAGGNLSAGKKAGLKAQINERLIKQRELDVYFPLVRRGRFKLSYKTTITNNDGSTRVEPVFLMFENRTARDNAEKEIASDLRTVGKPQPYEGDTDRGKFQQVASGSFVSEVLDVLSASGKDADSQMQEQVMRLFIESLPETSFAKSLQKRSTTIGYDKDVRGAMQNKGFDLSAQTAKMESSSKIRDIEKEIDLVYKAGAPKGVDSLVFSRIYKELGKRAKFAKTGAENKNVEPYLQRFNQIAFIYTIGFNASSALVNLSQIPMIVGPFLTGKFGFDETMSAMAQAAKFVSGAKLSIDEYYDVKEVSTTKNGVTTSDNVYSLKESVEKNIRESIPKKADADAKIAQFKRMAPMIKAANERGHIYHSEMKDMVGADDLGRGGNKNIFIKGLDTTSTWSAIMFSTAERFNRQTTMTMSYNLVLDKMDNNKRYYSALKGKFIDVPSDSESRMYMAADEAIYLTQELNGGTVLETASGFSQQGLGRVALMYKSHGMQMYYTMAKSAKLLLDNKFAKDAEGKQLRSIAIQQLAGVHLSALLFAGVQGVPLFGAVSMLFDIFFNDDEEDDARTWTRKYVGEGWYKGPLTESLGTDVASRIGLSNLLLQSNRFSKDPTIEETIGFYFGGPALSTARRFERAVKDLGEGEIERGIENLAPAGLTNAWRSTVGRYQREGGIRTRRYDPIYDDMTGGDFAAQALGFSPAEYTRRQEQSMRNKKVEDAVIGRRSRLTKKYYVAARMSDYEAMAELRLKMVEFNREHPSAGISPDSIMKSLDSHMETSAKMHNGVTINPLMKYAIDKSNKEYKR